MQHIGGYKAESRIGVNGPSVMDREQTKAIASGCSVTRSIAIYVEQLCEILHESSI